ncbi:MAG: toxin [Spirochaetales bacterium]|nr:toxin [Spirochaetales bacterium]
MTYNWNDQKNDLLKKERGISFEEIIILISEDNLVDILEHPNKEKYPDQYLYLINLENYIYVVPFVVNAEKEEIFLKTIFPSRGYTKKYLNTGGNHVK